MLNTLDIAIDFDGTCVTHEYPAIGKPIGSIPVLRKLVSNGHRLILYTMRSGDQLEEAVNWFVENRILLYGIQRNPTQDSWTSSPKCYAKLYIDDAALGIPLSFDKNLSERPFVNWGEVTKLLKEQEII